MELIEKAGLPVGTISGNYKKVSDNPSKWEWITPEDVIKTSTNNDRRAYLANKAPLITGIKELPATNKNYLVIGKKALFNMRQEVKRRKVICKINKCIINDVNQTHIFKDKNSTENQAMRVRALPFVFPIIEKFGVRGAETVRNDSEFQEIVGKADLTDRKGKIKRCAIAVIVVRNLKTNRQALTQLSVFVIDNKVIKSFDTDGLPTSRLVRNDKIMPSSKDSHLSACNQNLAHATEKINSLNIKGGTRMRLVIRKSALLELAKGLDGDSFEKIKAEIIAHLKGLENQENEPELAKAAEQLNSGEYMFSHLEKSLSGEWIEKAGYGIGTVRTWRGKKYKKIAQGKWARVYDKIDRGAKNAMTRLIHQAESIDTPEEMMRFVLANKQRFSDANGKPLDIVDRLNAVIDGKTYAEKKASRQDGHKIYSVEVMDLEQKKSRSQTNGAGVGLSQKPETQSADSNIPQSAGKSSRFAPSDSADIEKKEVIAEPVSQEKDRVEYPKTKDVLNEFKQLKNSSSKESVRFSMQGVYYDKENGVLAATDARRLKVVKVGDLTGFDKSQYVDIYTDGKNIVLKPNERLNKGSWGFPPYKKVIPSDSAMKIRAKLDNKVLAEKIKAMKADGSVSKRQGKGSLDTIRIDFEKNGNVMLDGTKIGSIGKQDNDLPSLYMNVHYLADAISAGKTSVLSLQEPNNGEFLRAMTMNTGCSTSIIMPQGAADKNVDYEARRAEAKYEKDKKDKTSTFKKEDFKSMSDAELKDYEAKLEKELLASNRGEPDYSEKYSHWQEVHRENNDRFHENIADEAKAENQREEEIKAEKKKEIKEKYNGYFDNSKGLERARAIKSLEKKYRFEGKVMSNKEFVEQAIDNGAEIKEREVNKLDYPSRVRWNRMNGYEQEQYEKRIKAAGKKTVYTIDGYEFPKDVVDYARFYKEKGKSSRLKEMQKRGLSTQVKKSDSLYEYVQKSIAALRACRAI